MDNDEMTRMEASTVCGAMNNRTTAPRIAVLLLIILILAFVGCKVFYCGPRNWPRNEPIDYEMIANKFRIGQDNVCFVDGKPISYIPYVTHLNGTGHCETIYGLGNESYVYVCDYDGKPVVIFNSTAEITNGIIDLNVNQLCTFLHLVPHLLDEIDYVINKNAAVFLGK